MMFDQDTIWNHAVDLAFDCLYLTHFFPNLGNNPLGRQVAGTASNLVDQIRPGSAWIANGRIERVQNLLAELARTLTTANGLGFLSDRARNLLQKRIHILARLLAYALGPGHNREEKRS